tara:strand:- start:223 stop:639 length:417 start_codon:yes stop_codon:yes gene_type:complete
MKKIFYILFALSIVFSCGTDSDSDSTTLNQDLVGSWYGTTVDNSIPPTSTDIDLVLNSDGEGEVLFNRTNLETFETTLENWDITWSSTSTILTINYYDYDLPDGEQLYDIETHNYVFIDNDTLEITEDDGDITIMYRN